MLYRIHPLIYLCRLLSRAVCIVIKFLFSPLLGRPTTANSTPLHIRPYLLVLEIPARYPEDICNICWRIYIEQIFDFQNTSANGCYKVFTSIQWKPPIKHQIPWFYFVTVSILHKKIINTRQVRLLSSNYLRMEHDENLHKLDFDCGKVT